MKATRWMFVSFLVAASLAVAQKREVQDLQRDVALLQDDVKGMRKTLDESTAAHRVLVQQILDTVNKINTNLAVMDSTIRDRLKEQEKNVVAPVAGVGTKIDQMTTEFSFVKESVTEMNSRMGKLERQIVDLGNAVKTLQAPPPPPPGASAAGAASDTPPAGMSAESLYQNALRDKTGGNLDLALQQFNDYLKYFGKTESAPNAQYQVGEIYYRNQDFDSALRAFDLVLEKYPENNKTPDAMLMKGMSLVKLGSRTEGARQFRELIDGYPGSPQATKADAELKRLGLATPRTKAKKKR